MPAFKPGFPLPFRFASNGREWLARQLDGAGMDYRRQDNCFPWLADYARAQQHMDQQLRTHWPELLDQIAQQLNPVHDQILPVFLCATTGRSTKANGPPMLFFAVVKTCSSQTQRIGNPTRHRNCGPVNDLVGALTGF